MDYLLQLLTTGVIIGGLYAMIALGFVLIFKATGVLNFAQGPMVVLGALFGWTAIRIWNLPVVLALDRGGIVGADGPTHHGLFDFSYLRHIPNIIVMAPKDENELQHMLKTAVCCGRPASVRYPRGNGWRGPLDEELKELPLGKAEVLEQGKDLMILAIGSCAQAALKAHGLLAEKGIQAAVVNARFVKPLDEELICSLASETGKVLTVEENALQGGFGSAVLELLGERGLKEVAVRRLGIPDVFVEHGSQEELRHKYGLDAEGIAQAAEGLVRGPGT